ncbi:MAG: hypothetical protein WCK21_11525, partial [Actinomycetota bacterium]
MHIVEGPGGRVGRGGDRQVGDADRQIAGCRGHQHDTGRVNALVQHLLEAARSIRAGIVAIEVVAVVVRVAQRRAFGELAGGRVERAVDGGVHLVLG